MGDGGVLLTARAAGVGGRMEIRDGRSGGARGQESRTGVGMNATAQSRGYVAAFFDIDGTLLAPPSLERQFLAALRYRQAIPARNYFLWLAWAGRMAPRGLARVRHSDKKYLRGVEIHAWKGKSRGTGKTHP